MRWGDIKGLLGRARQLSKSSAIYPVIVGLVTTLAIWLNYTYLWIFLGASVAAWGLHLIFHPARFLRRLALMFAAIPICQIPVSVASVTFKGKLGDWEGLFELIADRGEAISIAALVLAAGLAIFDRLYPYDRIPRSERHY